MKPGIVIIGAGVAGVTCALTLRNLGYQEKITLVSDEPGLPYKRTHLTKQLYRKILPGEFTTYSQEVFETLYIDYFDNRFVDRVDLVNQYLSTPKSKKWLEYSHLILATGSTPKPLVQIMNSYPVYREQHVHQLQQALDQDLEASIHVVGAGILGVEIAEQLTRKGRKVLLYCDHEYPMVRELPKQIGVLVRDLLISQGIHLFSSNSFTTAPTQGFVVSALGVEPNIQIAQSCGLPCDRGILVNEYLETAVPGVYAIGDCAQLPDGSISHLWHQAEFQGEYCARRVLGEKSLFQLLPFRTKAEVFGWLVFSCGSVTGITQDDYQIKGENLHLWVRLEENRTTGIAFLGKRDKAFAKIVQTAVREQWAFEQVERLAEGPTS
jgi:NAD(P)H-nitrite reductase large subunit